MVPFEPPGGVDSGGKAGSNGLHTCNVCGGRCKNVKSCGRIKVLTSLIDAEPKARQCVNRCVCVCMYVCVYVCMYVFLCVCMYSFDQFD